MKKTLTALAFTLVFLAIGSSLAIAQTGMGLIQGRVVNGTRGQEPVPGITVTLHIFDSQAVEKGSLATSTDEEGNFSFENLDTSSELFYVTAAEFDGVVYRSEVASFSEGQKAITLPLEVYETTRSDEAIVVEKAHFIIDVDLEHQALDVSEVYFINNTNTRTFIGQEEAEGRRYTLRFSLPPEAENPSARGLIIQGKEVLYPNPVIPGIMAEPIVLNYTLPIEGASMQLAHRIAYPIKDYNILVSDVGVEVKSPGTQFKGKAGQGQKMYLNYAGANVERGAKLVVELSGLSKKGALSRSRAFSPTVLVAVVLAALVLVGLFVAYPMLRSRTGPAPHTSRREQLLQELADLDDAFEQGTISEDEYIRKREDKKKQLLKLMQGK